MDFRKFKKLQRLFDEAGIYMSELSKEVNEICDFDASITYVDGDGICICDNSSYDLADYRCLEGKSKINKLTLKEFNLNAL